MPLLALIFAAMLCYTAFNVALAKAGQGLSPYLTTAVYSTVAAILCFALHFVIKATKAERLVPVSTSGLVWAAVAGVLISVFSTTLIKIFARGGLAYVMPAVFGGVIVLSIVAARILFKEHTSTLQMGGVFLIALGIAVVVYAKMYTPVR